MLRASLFMLFAACLLPSIHGSAIPMWEYLSRGEKMSHLFNLFVQQVEKYCASKPEPDCSKLLLIYGLTNLAKMEDESLDDMDPYQRGANEIGIRDLIPQQSWTEVEVVFQNSVCPLLRAEGDPALVMRFLPFDPRSVWEGYFTSASFKFWDSMMKGSSKQNPASIYTTKISSSDVITSTPNSIDISKEVKDLGSVDPGSLEAASSINLEETEPQSFLMGPMVVRVLPNGMPIPGEKNQFPKDEDVEELAPTRFRSFPMSQQPSTNKLGYGDNPGYLPAKFSPQPGHNLLYFRQPFDTHRVRPPAHPTNH